MHDAADAILRFVEGHDFSAYLADHMMRSAVERQFEIIGEALNRLSQHNPDLASRIPSRRRIIDFRNMLIHGYDQINDTNVWRTIENELPGLRSALADLLAELDGTPN